MRNNLKKYIAECIGTAVLVLFGCGTAIISGDILTTAMAFGLSIVAVAYAIGDISGAHVNPAVSFAMWIRGKLSAKDLGCYVLFQVIGAFFGSLLLWAIVAFTGTDKAVAGLGANTTSNLGIWGSLLVEVILTFVFVYTILGVTANKEKSHLAGIVIGLTLAFVHILGIRLTGTSVNPARSLAPAIIMGGEALSQVWVFIIAPFIGSAIAALTYGALNVEKVKKITRVKSK
jgi:aquaporin Z